MKKLVLSAAILLTGTFAMTVSAQTGTPQIDKRQANEQKRIDQGVKSGQLTQKETAKLERQQAKIEADKQKAKADGKVTKAERRKLKKEENRASKNINRKKHNARTAK